MASATDVSRTWRAMPYELCKSYAIKCMLWHCRIKNASNKYVWNDGVTQILIVDELNNTEVYSYRSTCMHKWVYAVWCAQFLPGIVQNYADTVDSHDITLFVWYFNDNKTFYKVDRSFAADTEQSLAKGDRQDVRFWQVLALQGRVSSDITHRVAAATGPTRDFDGRHVFYVRWLFPEMLCEHRERSVNPTIIVKHMLQPSLRLLRWNDALY